MILLKLAKALSANKIHRKKGVVGIGIGKKNLIGEDSLIVFVEKKLPKERLLPADLVPTKVMGVKTDVVETGEIELIHRKKHRPVRGGISAIWKEGTACTLGAIVEKDGKRYGLSNQHCFNPENKGCTLGQEVIQPSPSDGGNINDVIGTCKYSSKIEYGGMNQTDAALVELETVSTTDILGLGKISTTPKDPVAGMEVVKSGRTTGVTKSRIIATDVDANVWTTYNGNRIITRWKNQIFMLNENYSFVDGGDSGSLMLTGDSPVGLIFSASDKVAVATPIKRVMGELGFKFIDNDQDHYLALGNWLDIRGLTITTKDRTNLRSEPKIGNTVIGVLPPGTEVQIKDFAGISDGYYWFEVA